MRAGSSAPRWCAALALLAIQCGASPNRRGHRRARTPRVTSSRIQATLLGAPCVIEETSRHLKELLLHRSFQKWQRRVDAAMKVVLVKVKIKRVPEEFFWKGQMNNEWTKILTPTKVHVWSIGGGISDALDGEKQVATVLVGFRKSKLSMEFVYSLHALFCRDQLFSQVVSCL